MTRAISNYKAKQTQGAGGEVQSFVKEINSPIIMKLSRADAAIPTGFAVFSVGGGAVTEVSLALSCVCLSVGNWGNWAVSKFSAATAN